MATKGTPSKPTPGPHYQVVLGDLHAHLFSITLTVQQPAPVQTLSLPVWIPGSYLVREFAKHLQSLRASQGAHERVVQQVDKTTWQVPCSGRSPLTVHYQVYAHDASVRAAWLDAHRAFFNGTSLLLRVHGQTDLAHTLDLPPAQEAAGWSVATAAEPIAVDANGFGSYRTPDYDALVDCPVEMGRFWSGSFEARGIAHRFVVAGAAPSLDGARLCADARAICAVQWRFWHGENYQFDSKQTSTDAAYTPIPFKNYVFLLNAVGEDYGGLEHRNSTALIAPRKDLPRLSELPTPSVRGEGYTRLLGLISHEYFHSWNVKRLRPREFARYDYTQENYTRLLWFFEGVTSYYDDLLLLRAGCIDHGGYLQLLGKAINQLAQTPGRLLHSVAQASQDAWTKYYRPDENTPNATVSYYTKGALVALCLDLSLRREGHSSLDDVMRALWQRTQGGPMDEEDLLAVLQQQGRRSYRKELQQWVHGTSELPVDTLLKAHGIALRQEPDALAQQLGLRVKEGNGLYIQHVLRGSAAERAGFAAGDEWISVQTSAAQTPWRLHTLDELPLYRGRARKLRVQVARDKRLLSLQLLWPAPSHCLRLDVHDATLAARWLDGA